MTLKASSLISRNFIKVLQSILKHEYRFYTFAGGRNSLKSSFISIAIITLIIKYDYANALILRKVSNTLADSVYSQLQWAISMLGVEEYFKCTVTPMKIVYVPTGQTIVFRGVDKPSRLKSIKLRRGYFAVAWYEESTEFTPEEVRSVNQTILRGGNSAFWIFDSFNPPVSARNWKNTEILLAKPNRMVHYSTMFDAPPEWVGLAALEEAEYLRKTNKRMFDNEIMGLATGTGTNVFENITVRKITDEEINSYEWIYRGIDWGYYPDPFVYCEACYDAEKKALYIYKGFSLLRSSNPNTEEELIKRSVSKRDAIVADNDMKDINDFRSWGWNIRTAEKGKGSVEAGFKWLQSLTEIVIDNDRVPEAVAEFTQYEYDVDKNGNVLSGYPQGQADHYMASVRYMMEPVWKRRGL